MTDTVSATQTSAISGGRRASMAAPAWIYSLILLLVFIGVWEGYVRLWSVSAFILPPPSRALASWIEAMGTRRLWVHTWVTVQATALGFFFATITGVALGVLLGKIKLLEQILSPFIIATQVIPKVALVPLFIVWFGFGLTTKVVIAAVLAFFPILVNTILGVKSVDRGHQEVMISLNSNRWQTLTQLTVPSALPYILTGMEMGVVLSIIGAVVGEYLGGNAGLGNIAVQEMNAFNTSALFGVIIHLSVLGFAFFFVIVAARRFLIPWHDSSGIKRNL